LCFRFWPPGGPAKYQTGPKFGLRVSLTYSDTCTKICVNSSSGHKAGPANGRRRGGRRTHRAQQVRPKMTSRACPCIVIGTNIVVTKEHHIALASRLHGTKMKNFHIRSRSTPSILMVAKTTRLILHRGRIIFTHTFLIRCGCEFDSDLLVFSRCRVNVPCSMNIMPYMSIMRACLQHYVTTNC
jgi:hypothetical protein